MKKGNREAWPGDHLRFEYDLDENSIVIDLGGHHGYFTEQISRIFNCYVYTFEPVSMLHEICSKKFEHNNKIKVYKTGLSDDNKLVDFIIGGESSTIYGDDTIGEYNVKLTKIDDFLSENEIESVDLIKMNIEGSEYELLEHMLKNNLVKKFKNLQIQFHDNVFPNWEERYNFIKENLKLTHHLTYEYEFKFENWQIN